MKYRGIENLHLKLEALLLSGQALTSVLKQ